MLPHNKKNIIRRRSNSRGRSIYTTKKYPNPFFNNKKKSTRNKRVSFSFKSKVVFWSVFAVIFFSIYFFLYSGYFVITKIDAEGNGRLNPADIEGMAWEQVNSSWFVLFPQKNIFWFKPGNLKAKLNQKFAFKKLQIVKKYPGKILINYEEKAYTFIWLKQENYFYIDENGFIIANTDKQEIKEKQYPIIEDQSDEMIVDKNVPASKEYLDYILKANEEFKKERSEFKVEKYIFDNEKYKIKIKLLQGPEIYLTIKRGVREQLKKLLILKKENLKEDFFKKQYFDLRIGSSVYYQ